MSVPELPLKDAASRRTQNDVALQPILAHLKEQPVLLITIGALFAVAVLLVIGVVPDISSHSGFLLYTFVLISLILMGGIYLSTQTFSAAQESEKQAEIIELPADDACWPHEKSAQTLAAKLSDLSISQRRMLRIIRDTNGIMAFRLADQMSFPREEVIYRCSELEKQGLIIIEPLNDLFYTLPEEIELIFQRKQIQNILNMS